MSSADPPTSIPVHQSTIRYLQGFKTGAQTWDEFLMLVGRFLESTISPETRAELTKRARERHVSWHELQKDHRSLQAKGR